MKTFFGLLLTFFVSNFASAQMGSNNIGEVNIELRSAQELSSALTRSNATRPQMIIQNGKLVNRQAYDPKVDLCYFYSPDALDFDVAKNFHLDLVFQVGSRDQNMISLIQRISRAGNIISGFAIVCENDDLSKSRNWFLGRIKSTLGDLAKVVNSN